MITIYIRKSSIVDAGTEVVVNAANEHLVAGAGVCGAIFKAAGHDKLQKACKAIGHCDTGEAVITPGFALNAKYIVHAVGPRWNGGQAHEDVKLHSCYYASLNRAKEAGCYSITFPLISAGIFGYPVDGAWDVAIKACKDWANNHVDYGMEIEFAILDDRILEKGKEVLGGAFWSSDFVGNTASESKETSDDGFCFFWKLGEKNDYLSQWYPCKFRVEGIEYSSAEQYMMAKKALMFNDFVIYKQIMSTDDPALAKELGKKVSGFKGWMWDACKEEIVRNGNTAKFNQNNELGMKLDLTGTAILAEASPKDKVWGIGMAATDKDARTPAKWKGKNLLGKVLMEVRENVYWDEGYRQDLYYNSQLGNIEDWDQL